MTLHIRDYRVPEAGSVRLKKWPTRVAPVYGSKQQYDEMLADHVARLNELQQLLYAANTHSVLLVFQALDAAGKDGVIRHVMSGVNPQGCQVFSFKHPSVKELQHDFLWRCTRDLPERGRIGIFNRSYYEEVLIVRVHPEILLAEGLHKAGGKADRKEGDKKDHDKNRHEKNQFNKIWRHRYRSINNLEQHLTESGTTIVKFFLHMSKEEQLERFLARIDTPDKNWKFSQADVEERGFWDDYMEAYEDCLSTTSTADAPWYIVPADDKRTARLIVSQIIVETLDGLNMRYPQTDATRQAELDAIRGRLLREKT